MDNSELTREDANPKAQKILTEDFYWSPIEESGPFGSDDGADAFYGFRNWRKENVTVSPVAFLQLLIKDWDYEAFDWNEERPEKIKEYLSKSAEVDLSGVDLSGMIEHFKEQAEARGEKFDEVEFKKKFTGVQKADLGERHLVGQDNAIIAIGFGQFVLEGKIDEDIRLLTKRAIQRQLLPILIDRYEEEYRKIRREQLSKMLVALDKMSS